MSLTVVHLFFISLSVVLTVWFGLWEASRYSAAARGGDLLLAILSFGSSALLIVYGIRFMRKAKEQGL